jgi:hypothetical protein
MGPDDGRNGVDEREQQGSVVRVAAERRTEGDGESSVAGDDV